MRRTRILTVFILFLPAVLGFYNTWKEQQAAGGGGGGTGTSQTGTGSGSSFGSGNKFGASSGSYGGSSFTGGGSYGGYTSGGSFGGSGLSGVINNMISSTKDVVKNSFDTSKLTLNSLKDLLENTNYMLMHNPLTQPIAGYESGLGTSLRTLSAVYMESIDPVVEMVFARTGRIEKIKEKLEMTEKSVQRIITDVEMQGGRCLNSRAITEVTEETYKCSLIPVHEVITEMTATQNEVKSLMYQLSAHLTQRDMCTKMPISQAVTCVMELVLTTPNLLHGFSGIFSVHNSLQANMLSINDCTRRVRDRIKELCGSSMYSY